MIGSKSSIKCSVCDSTIRLRMIKYIKDGLTVVDKETRVMALDRHYKEGHR